MNIFVALLWSLCFCPHLIGTVGTRTGHRTPCVAYVSLSDCFPHILCSSLGLWICLLFCIGSGDFWVQASAHMSPAHEGHVVSSRFIEPLFSPSQTETSKAVNTQFLLFAYMFIPEESTSHLIHKSHQGEGINILELKI